VDVWRKLCHGKGGAAHLHSSSFVDQWRPTFRPDPNPPSTQRTVFPSSTPNAGCETRHISGRQRAAVALDTIKSSVTARLRKLRLACEGGGSADLDPSWLSLTAYFPGCFRNLAARRLFRFLGEIRCRCGGGMERLGTIH
jgi:hypothetical protein